MSNSPDFIASIVQAFGLKQRDIWVLLSKDRSTIICDPGTRRPWFAKGPTARKVADHMAKQVGRGVIAAELNGSLINFIIKHPKNQPHD
jgi:hypothetical protein